MEPGGISIGREDDSDANKFGGLCAVYEIAFLGVGESICSIATSDDTDVSWIAPGGLCFDFNNVGEPSAPTGFARPFILRLASAKRARCTAMRCCSDLLFMAILRRLRQSVHNLQPTRAVSRVCTHTRSEVIVSVKCRHQ